MNSKKSPVHFVPALALVLWSAAAGAAEIEGSVVLDGAPPAPQALTIKAKSKEHSIEGCGAVEKVSPKLRVSAEGGVRDAVVWVDVPTAEGAAWRTGGGAAAPLLIDQKECVFSPHVVAIAAGDAVAIRNSDGVIHNVRIFPDGKLSMLMHRWQKADAADIPWRFDEPGRYVVRCGVHPWMYAWVFVAPGALVAVTDEDGRFMLSGIPPGKHTLRVWHETLSVLEVPVEVGPEGGPVEPVHFPPVSEGG